MLIKAVNKIGSLSFDSREIHSTIIKKAHL